MTIKYIDTYNKVLPALQSKIEEFQHFGYNSITLDELWNFLLQKKWRKKLIENLRLHEIVESIFSIKASEIMSFTQIKDFQTKDWFGEINQDELNELFRKEPKEKE